MPWSDITMLIAVVGLAVSACSPLISSFIEYRSKLKIAKFSHFSKCRSESASLLLTQIGKFRYEPPFYANDLLSALYAYSLYAASDELALIQPVAEQINSEKYSDAITNLDRLQQLMSLNTDRLYRLDPRRKKPR